MFYHPNLLGKLRCAPSFIKLAIFHPNFALNIAFTFLYNFTVSFFLTRTLLLVVDTKNGWNQKLKHRTAYPTKI